MYIYIIISILAIVLIIATIVHTGTVSPNRNERATFAGGCFWCMVHPFDRMEGVVEVISGYTGGTTKNPTYKEVSGGESGHYEAVQITFDPGKISYRTLLDAFWRQIDPTDERGQFVDKGPQYRSAIFYHSPEQQRQAEDSKAALAKSGKFNRPIATLILPATEFFRAEDYHQNYYRKNPDRYLNYRAHSGREQFIRKMWGDANRPSKEELRKRLLPLQFKVTQECGTEPAFNNEYWDNHREGIYVDIVSGEVLFSSRDKFDSGTGWPSFTKPVDPNRIIEKVDTGMFMTRTEVRSKTGDSHLGHVFADGPKPAGLRYCINSAALRFIPKEDLDREGYGAYKKLFE